VTTQTAINDFIDLTSAFGIDVGVKKLDISFPKDKNFLTSDDSDVEGDDSSERLDAGTVSALKGLLGEHFAIAKSLDDYGLPVIARNNLQGSGNLWYEEYVPHGSRFYMLAILPDGADASEAGKVIPEIAQVGGNSSIGYGYCSFRLCETNGGSK
jgi:CRISPR-associated protein Cmr4